MLTNLYLSNLKDSQPQRKIPVQKIKAATKSAVANNFEFVIHVSKEYDYRFVCKDRDEFFNALKKVFFDYRHQNLPIYGVPYAKLKDYSTSKKDMKRGIEVIPEDNYRIRTEDVYDESAVSTATSSFASKQGSAGANVQSQFSDEFMNETRAPARTLYAKAGDTQIGLSDFEIKKVIGRGSFGKVFLV